MRSRRRRSGVGDDGDGVRGDRPAGYGVCRYPPAGGVRFRRALQRPDSRGVVPSASDSSGASAVRLRRLVASPGGWAAGSSRQHHCGVRVARWQRSVSCRRRHEPQRSRHRGRQLCGSRLEDQPRRAPTPMLGVLLARAVAAEAVLRGAGVEPDVVVSDVDEAVLLAELGEATPRRHRHRAWRSPRPGRGRAGGRRGRRRRRALSSSAVNRCSTST